VIAPRHARRFSDETFERMAAMRAKNYSWRFVAHFFNYESERDCRRDFREWQRRKEKRG